MKIILEIPRRSVEALLVAIGNHAHGFGVSSENLMKEMEDRKDLRTKENAQTLRVWTHHAIDLTAVKIEIKRQVGIK